MIGLPKKPNSLYKNYNLNMKKFFRILLYLVSLFLGFYISLFLLLYYSLSSNEASLKLYPVPIYDQSAALSKKELALALYNPTTKQKYNLAADTDSVLFVNLWATWCAPCIAEMPSIDSLKKSLKDYPVAFMLVSQENPEKVKKFAEKKKHLSLDFYSTSDSLSAVFDGNSIPRTYIIHKKQIIYQHGGMVNWNSHEVRNIIKKALQKNTL